MKYATLGNMGLLVSKLKPGTFALRFPADY
jgi:hypothetical protein